jgi:Ni/Fe-hydrogenase subunit HybB-like protein
MKTPSVQVNRSIMENQENSQSPFEKVNQDIVDTMTQSGSHYYLALGISFLGFIVFWIGPWTYQLITGQGLTGLNTPAVWGIYLVNFVFWIGISHSGTLLSAILFITETPWRRAIYRSAEAMTFFSIITAAFFIFVHMGRPWNFYWLLPLPNLRYLWVNFSSPLMFDIFAIGTYMTSSAIFLYVGSIPDLAAVRDRVSGWRKTIYTTLALGWRGTDFEWHWLFRAYTFFAVLIVPLAVSVHSIVSWDFALSNVAGFAQTIFAPYFVVGAIYSGSAGIITLIAILRKTLKIEKYITPDHFNKVNMLLVALSLLWTYINILEIMTSYYANNIFENDILAFRLWTPPYSYLFWLMILLNSVLPLLLIFKKVRFSITISVLISLGINVGMWLERYLIIAPSLSRKFLPYMWHNYIPSWIEISITLGSFSFFTMLFLLFVKFWPSVSIYEVKEDFGILSKK